MPLRDIFIVGAVIVLAVLALRRPWIGVMNWTWLSIMNPHRYTWGFAYNAPLAQIAAGSTLIALLFTKDRHSPFQGAPTWWLLVFIGWITLSWLFGFDPEADYWDWDRAMKIYMMTFVALALLHNKHQLMAFAWVTVGSLALLAAKGGLFTVLTGGSHRVWGPATSFISDNNHFAAATIVVIPMLHFLQLQLRPGWQRHLMSVVMLLCAAAAIGSHSRGAFLALAAMGAVFWWRSPRKGMIALVAIVFLLAFLPIMPEQWWDRMHSIKDYEEDASAMGRINAWLVALEVAKHNFFGGGMTYQHEVYFVAYGVYETTVRAAHSIYFQILGNHGFGGLFLYLMIWVSTLLSAGRLRILAREHEKAKWAGDLASMVQVSLISYAVGGAFLSIPYFDLPYNLMVLVVLARKWVESRAWETEPDMSFLEYAGFRKRKRSTTKRPDEPTAAGNFSGMDRSTVNKETKLPGV